MVTHHRLTQVTWKPSPPIREGITYIMCSLIGWDKKYIQSHGLTHSIDKYIKTVWKYDSNFTISRLKTRNQYSEDIFIVVHLSLLWRLNGRQGASRLFTQLCIQTHIKQNPKAPRHMFLWGWPVDSPAQRASNAEKDSIWWRHHISSAIETA